jgi:ABC-type lipoprotein release transport system permease subunit
MLNDVRFAIRLLLKSPGFAAAAIAAVLYQVSPHDFLTFSLVTVALGTIALLASYIPAARVMRTDPMIALSHNT